MADQWETTADHQATGPTQQWETTADHSGLTPVQPQSWTQFALGQLSKVVPFGTDRYTPEKDQGGYVPRPSLYNIGLRTIRGAQEGWEGIKQTFQNPLESLQQDPVGAVQTLSLPATA